MSLWRGVVVGGGREEKTASKKINVDKEWKLRKEIEKNKWPGEMTTSSESASFIKGGSR